MNATVARPSIAILLIVAPWLASVTAQEARLHGQRILLERGAVEQVNADGHVIKVRDEKGSASRYYFVGPYARLLLDGRPASLNDLRERTVVDVHLLEGDNILLSVAGYRNSPAPPRFRVPAGPFQTTEKLLAEYPRPNPAMRFAKGEDLRLAVPRQHLVPLARTDSELANIYAQFTKLIGDPALDIFEPTPVPIVPLGTKAKIIEVRESAYEVEIAEGRYRGWHVFVKKEWAYPANEAQAAKKAQELSAQQPQKTEPRKSVEQPAPVTTDDDREAKAAAEKQGRERLEQARAYVKLGQRDKAIEELERIRIEFPGSEAAKEARKLLDELKKPH